MSYEIDRESVSGLMDAICVLQETGRQRAAESWARELVRLLGCSAILSADPLAPVLKDSGPRDGDSPHDEIEPHWCVYCDPRAVR